MVQYDYTTKDSIDLAASNDGAQDTTAQNEAGADERARKPFAYGKKSR